MPCSVFDYHHRLFSVLFWVILGVSVSQSCPTLCDPVDCSQSGSSVHGILQARMLEWGSLSLLQGTQVSHITGGFFTIWATREALEASGLFCCCCCCCVASVVSDSVRPHRRKPTRLRCPWDSPGKNTGVGCYFLFQCIKVKREREVAQSRPTLSGPMDCSPPCSSIHGISQARVLEWGATAFSEKAMGYSRS